MSFGKPITSFCNIHSTFISFLILTLFISLPASSFSEETAESLELQRHLVLITKKTIVLKKEIEALRKKSETKANLQKIIDLQAQIDRLNLNFYSLTTNLSLEDSSLNLMAIIQADGKCTDRHEENRREIQTALVQICNENNLSIPFSQLTINMADQDSNRFNSD